MNKIIEKNNSSLNFGSRVYIYKVDNEWVLSNKRQGKILKTYSSKEAAFTFAKKITNVEIIFIKHTKEEFEKAKQNIKKIKKEIAELKIKQKEKDALAKQKYNQTIKKTKISSHEKFNVKNEYELKISDIAKKSNIMIQSKRQELFENKKIIKSQWSKNILPNHKLSFFSKERKFFLSIAIINIIIISLFVAYFAITIILPFLGQYALINNIQYFGWPIWSTLFLLIWVPALFISINILSKRKLTDFQMILENKKIKIAALLLMIPTLGVSLAILWKVTANLYETREFKEFVKTNKNINGKQIWLKDDRPTDSKTAGSLGLAWLLIIFWSLIIIYPIYKLIKETFNGTLGTRLGSTSTYKFSFKHFERLFSQYNYMDWMLNTLFISIITMILIVVLATFASYVYSRNKFKSKKTTLLLVMV